MLGPRSGRTAHPAGDGRDRRIAHESDSRLLSYLPGLTADAAPGTVGALATASVSRATARRVRAARRARFPEDSRSRKFALMRTTRAAVRRRTCCIAGAKQPRSGRRSATGRVARPRRCPPRWQSGIPFGSLIGGGIALHVRGGNDWTAVLLGAAGRSATAAHSLEHHARSRVTGSGHGRRSEDPW